MEILQEEQNQQNKNIKQYNKRITLYYLRNSTITILAYVIMIIFFVISAVMTYSRNQSSSVKYGITSFNPQVLIQLGGNLLILVKRGQVYRLIMPIFLHAGILHFFVNSVSIFGLLMLAQPQFKRIIFGLSFIIGGIQGNMLSCLENEINKIYNAVGVGASTSICAILGLNLASLYIQSLKNGNTQQAKKKIVMMVGYLFLLSMLPGIDLFGHFGSLISGALIGLSFKSIKDQEPQEIDKIKKIRLICLIVLVVYSLFLLSIFWI